MFEYEIWTQDMGPMPSCVNCQGGLHHNCMDLLWSETYGIFACGCTNEVHNAEYQV